MRNPVARTSDHPPADDLVDALLTASRVLDAVCAASLTAGEDTVTSEQFCALALLNRSDGIHLNGLAEQLGLPFARAMRLVDRLVCSDLVRRTHDRLALTPAGEQLVHQVIERHRAELAPILHRMAPDLRADLITALTDFTNAAVENPTGE